MNSWGVYPFVRIIIPFISGILIFIFFNLHFPAALLYVLLSTTLIIHLLIRKRVFRFYKYITIAGIIYQLTVLVAANHWCFVSTDFYNANNYLKHISRGQYAIVKVTEQPVTKEKSVSTQVDVAYILENNLEARQYETWKPCSGKAIIYFKKDSNLNIQYGDYFIVKNNFNTVPQPKNPDEFNYQKYLFYKEIYATAFVKAGEWKQLNYSERNSVWELTFRLRDLSLAAFEKYIPLDRERSVANALVIGDRDNMSYSLMQSYTSAGVIHVLAVSGLHVAILYTLLELLTMFLRRKKNGKYFQGIIILIIIWMFCLLTGLSGSVIRAGTMFTFITVGKMFRRSINTYNILASSALVILLYNPLLIMDVGFQLSYVAVIGITTLYDYINAWLLRENKIIDKAWNLSSISIAAQTATFPVTSFYFNQFPIYFLLANLLVIPLSGIILQLGLALIVLQSMPVVAPLLGHILTWGLYVLDEYIIWIQQLPLSVIHFSRISMFVTILMALILILIVNFFITRKKILLFSSLFLLMIATGAQSFNIIRNQTESSLTVYNFKGKTYMEFCDRGKIRSLFSGKEFTPQEITYLNKHHQLRSRQRFNSHFPGTATNRNSLLLNIEDQFIQFSNFKMAIVKKNVSENLTPSKIQVDAVLISNNPFLNIKNLTSVFETKLLIFDASNSKSRIKFWRKEAAKYNIDCFSTDESGAYVAAL